MLSADKHARRSGCRTQVGAGWDDTEHEEEPASLASSPALWEWIQALLANTALLGFTLENRPGAEPKASSASAGKTNRSPTAKRLKLHTALPLPAGSSGQRRAASHPRALLPLEGPSSYPSLSLHRAHWACVLHTHHEPGQLHH